MENRHPWQTSIRVKGSDKRLLVLIFDSILGYVNEFVSTSKLMQSRKDKINSKGYTERFLSSLFLSRLINYVTNSRKSVYSKTI